MTSVPANECEAKRNRFEYTATEGAQPLVESRPPPQITAAGKRERANFEDATERTHRETEMDPVAAIVVTDDIGVARNTGPRSDSRDSVQSRLERRRVDLGARLFVRLTVGV